MSVISVSYEQGPWKNRAPQPPPPSTLNPKGTPQPPRPPPLPGRPDIPSSKPLALFVPGSGRRTLARGLSQRSSLREAEVKEII